MLLSFRHDFPKRDCWASNGDGSGAAADPGAGGGGHDSGSSSPAPDWGKFTESLQNIPAAIKAEMQAQVGELRSLRGTVEQGLRPPEPPAPELPDFDTMSQSEVVGWMTEHNATVIRDAVREALTPLAEQFTNFQSTVVTDSAKREVDRLKSDHKDFTDWKDEMVGLARTHPTLDIPSLYRLARANDPVKAQKLETQYNPPPPPRPRPFSLTPGMSPGSNPGGERTLTKEQAIHSAAMEVNERHPGVLAALRDL